MDRNWCGSKISRYNRFKIEKVCFELLNRLEDIEALKQYIQNDYSLANGYAGIILFLNELSIITGNNMDNKIHIFLKNAVNFLENSRPISPSLFKGIAGFNHTVSLVNKNTNNYYKLLNKLDNILIIYYEKYIRDLKLYKSNNKLYLPIDLEYDVIYGVSGIARYVLERYKSNGMMEQIANQIIFFLINLTKDILHEGRVKKGWYSHSYNQKEDSYYIDYEHCYYNLGLAHGISGPLAILSIFLINGFELKGQKEAIQIIINWLKQIDSHIQDTAWPYTIKDIDFIDNSDYRFAWCYGIPGIAISMLLAGKALNNISIIDDATRIFGNIFKYDFNKWNINSPIICHGYGGVLQIAYRMLYYNHKERAFSTEIILEKLLNTINYNQNYCFDNIDNRRGIENPDFLMGSTGVGLVLLSSISNIIPMWDSTLLLC